jgi:hypothetical protein
MPKDDLRPAIRPVPMNLYPTMNSLRDVVDYANSQLPVTVQNQLFAILATYHNTLIAELKKAIEE